MAVGAARNQADEGLADCRLYYESWGDRGPRVLLIHAIGFDHTTWQPILPALCERCRVVAVDLPGHGKSDKPLAVDYSLPAVARRMVRFLDELGWDEAILIGNSIGGGTSLATTLLAPERVRALGLLNSVAYPELLPPLGRLAFVPLVGEIGAFAPRLAIRVGLELVRHGWGSVTVDRASACGTYLRAPEGRGAFFRMLRQLYGPELAAQSRRYREIRCPALVLHGMNDPLIPLRSAQRLAWEIPNAELLQLPRCGHFPQEESPERVSAALTRFLDRLERA